MRSELGAKGDPGGDSSGCSGDGREARALGMPAVRQFASSSEETPVQLAGQTEREKRRFGPRTSKHIKSFVVSHGPICRPPIAGIARTATPSGP